MLKRILGLLGWLGVALVFAAVAIRFLKPEWQQYYNGLAIGGLVCTLLYILSQWREIGQAFAGRQARFGTLAAASILVVLAILAAINYLSTRYNKRWDLTAASQFSLSDQTKKVLQGLKEPVKVRVFAESKDFERYRDRLDEYAYQSKQISTEFIDPLKKPGPAEALGVTTLPTIDFEYKGRHEKANSDGEQELTQALIKVIEGRQPKVYFTEGHGEKDTAGAEGASSYGGIAAALKSANFVLDKVVLGQTGKVPDDADILIIAGPKTDFLGQEIDAVKAYLAKAGKVMIMLDPVLKPDEPQPVALQALLKEWGIDAGNDVVLDLQGLSNGTAPIAATYPAHAITDKFGRLLTAYPIARSMTPVDGGADGRTAQPLVQTGPNSWGETNFKSLAAGEPAKADGDDKKGPISLGAAVSVPGAAPPPAAVTPPAEPTKEGDKPKPVETRLVAFGDSDFASNGALRVPGNEDLFLNSVNWLAQQENLIAIRPRDPEDRRITLTPDQERRIFYLTVLIVPGLILLAGVQTWWRRR
jgi:ABC-type uncharacterized transport system involved in gliding motility auxiliary subunit